ncbi:MAG: hypothetical protein JWM65_47 [Sphingomonas bacterium]|nr:hypothetical protein [Sphingomonas bacterium]
MSFIAAAKERPSLTYLDWVVVALARTEKCRSVEPEGRLTRFLMRFFGLRTAPALASERLEALRRFCVTAWHRDVIHKRDVSALIEAGYDVSDATQVLMHIVDSRGFAPRLEEQLM